MPEKKILYLDMDGVLVDFESGILKLDEPTRQQYQGQYENVPGIFATMNPLPGALEAFNQLVKVFDVYLLSTAPWDNSSAWSDKHEWVIRHLGVQAEKRLILSHNKHLNRGDFLVDDRLKHGVDKFQGEHIHFGTKQYPDWPTVLNYLLSKS